MTMQEAVTIAAQAQPKELWLTHYSPSMMHPEEFLPELKKTFERTLAVRDGRKKTLKYDDGGENG